LLVVEVDLMRIELHEAIRDLAMRSGQEARAHAPGARAEPQIEARGLNLPVEKRTLGRDRAFCDECLDLMSRKNAATPLHDVTISPGRFEVKRRRRIGRRVGG
jgi:hypothetical protein